VGGGGARVTAVLVAPGTLEPGAVVELDAAEAHHLRVRRAAAGEVVRLLDGAGGIGEGTLAGGGTGWRAQVMAVRRVAPPPPLVLAVGAGDRERFALVVEKAAELGATAVVPLETERSRNVAGRVRPAHAERLRQRGLEALKQCGGAWAPYLSAPVGLEEFLGSASGVRWLADAEGGGVPALAADDAVTVAIGPEGGFTPGERSAILAAGFVAVRLGARVLRFETAAVAAATAVHLRRGSLEAE
jgi:16S rRNA (uracil1498-N3)-methyltransferase